MKAGKTLLLLLLGVLMSGSIGACGIFKSAEDDPTKGKLNQQEEAVLNNVINKNIDEPQDQGKNGDETSKWGEDSATAVKKYSLYTEYYDQNNYKDAYPYWRWMYFNAPKQSVNLYIHGANMLEYKYNNAPKGKQQAYIDSLMMLYDQRTKHFNEKGYVMGRKGMHLMKLDPNQFMRGFKILDKAIDIQGYDIKSYVPYYYVFALIKQKRYNKINQEVFFNRYEKINKIIDHNLNNSRNAGKWESIRNRVDNLVAPYMACDYLLSLYKPKFESQQSNVDKLKKIQTLLENNDCTEAPFYMKLSEKIFEKDPTAKAAYNLAKGWENKGNNTKAMKFFKRAMELESDKEKSGKYALSMASIYKEQKSLIKAKEYAKQSIDLRPENRKGYIILGDIYIEGKDRCGDDFKQKTVYWVAVDQYQKAKEVDPSGAERAQRRIKKYKQAFPTKEKTFFRNLSPGDEYQVDCWVNETTTIRVVENQ